MLELKSPQQAQHLATLLGEPTSDKYVKQCLWQLACCPQRKWVDWVSYNPEFPLEMQIVIRRILRDDKRIAELEAEVRTFLAEVDRKVAELKARYATEGTNEKAA